MSKKLTAKQQKVYDCIVDFTNRNGYPPSVRDIGKIVGLKSPSTVHVHLKTLEEHGLIHRDDKKTRAITLPTAKNYSMVPILGRVTAGIPILAVEEITGYIPYPGANGSDEYFGLNVRGDSMIDAGIYDGDTIIVRRQQTALNGDIVVALIEDEATVKRLKFDGRQVWLMPENPAYSPIDGNHASILGKVTAIYRSLI